VVGIATLLVTVGEAPVLGADKQACVTAHEEAQRLRQGGKLREAREKLVACAQDGCPAMVRADCGPWLGEIDNELPTIVIAARDAKGTDVPDVRVTIDRSTVLSRLDGKALSIDPGEHVLQFERPPSPAIAQTVVVHEGEKGRIVEVQFASPETASALSGTAKSPVPFVLLGVGAAAAFGTSLYLALHVRNERDAMTCSPHCSDDAVAPLRNQLHVADAALGVGLVLTGVATWLFFASPKAPPTSTMSMPVLPRFVTNSAAFQVRCVDARASLN
jgi:hypothetical protein